MWNRLSFVIKFDEDGILNSSRVLRFRLLGAVCFLLAFSASAFSRGAEVDAAVAKPTTEIDLSAWGFRGLPSLERFTLRGNVTVNFLDSNRLLITFDARKLMRRLPECPPTHQDRIIHAEVFDLASSKVIKESEWYVHDKRRYLWPLTPGRFVLRKLNSLYELDSDLHETLLTSFSSDLLWADTTPDGKQIVTETPLGGTSETKRAETNGKPQIDHDQRARVKVDFLNASSLAVERTMQATGVLELGATSSGYADVTRNSRGNVWLVRFGPSLEQRQRVARVKSPCAPDLLFPTSNTVLIGRCSANSPDYSVSVFSLRGYPLWRQRWPQLNHFPAIARSEDGSRFAIGTITSSREPSPVVANDEDSPGWPDVEQDIRIFETASGKLILSARVKSVVLKNPNFALAPEGNRFALLDGSILKVYDLPPMPPEERAKYVAMAADAPGLSPPAVDSAAIDTDTVGMSGSSDSDEDAGAGDPDLLAAPPKPSTTAGAPVDIPAASAAMNPSTSPNSASAATTPDRGQAPVSTFKAAVKEVVVDVVVTDTRGHPVKGLSPEDFQIEEDWRPQKIKYFHEFAGSVEAATAIPPTNKTEVPPNVFSNNVTPRPDQPLVVVVLDFVNTLFEDQQYAKDQLLKFLRKKPNGMQFALFLLASRLELLHGFTADENVLVATVNSKKSGGRNSRQLEPTIDMTTLIQANKDRAAQQFSNQIVVQQLEHLQAETRAWDLDRRVALTIDALSQLARYAAGVQGRKNVVWLSGSFPRGFFPNMALNSDVPTSFSAEVRTYGDQLRKVTNQLAEAHVAVYPVDVRGNLGDSIYAAETNVNPLTPAAPGSQAQGPPGRTPPPPGAGTTTAMSLQSPSALQQQFEQNRDSRAAEQATMDEVADGTGGKAFYNTNGIQQAIEAAVEQGSEYYMFSYSPDNVKFDGGFRKLRVSLARRGYHLAYRHGYYANPPEAPIKNSSELAQEIGLSGMQLAAPQSHQLVFAARVVPVGKPVKRAAVQGSETVTGPEKKTEVQHYSIDYAIAGPQLGFTLNGELRHAVLDFIVSAFRDDGSNVARTAVQTTSDLKPSVYQDVIVGGLRMHQEVDVPVNAVSLRLGVMDELARHLGTVELPLPLKTPADESDDRGRRLPPVEPD